MMIITNHQGAEIDAKRVLEGFTQWKRTMGYKLVNIIHFVAFFWLPQSAGCPTWGKKREGMRNSVILNRF